MIDLRDCLDCRHLTKSSASMEVIQKSSTPRMHHECFGTKGFNTDDLANDLSKYVVTKLKRLSETIADGLKSSLLCPSIYPPLPVSGKLETFSPVTVDEVIKPIESTSVKASHLGVMTSSIIKSHERARSDDRPPTWLQLLQRCQISSVYKDRSGNRVEETGAEHYRLQNLSTNYENLTTISKIIESLALHRLRPHLVSSPNYCRLQFSDFTGRSTETALAKITVDISNQVCWWVCCRAGESRYLSSFGHG